MQMNALIMEWDDSYEDVQSSDQPTEKENDGKRRDRGEGDGFIMSTVKAIWKKLF